MAAGVNSRGRLTIPDLKRKIAGLREAPFRRELSQVLAVAAGTLVNDGFRNSVNPYGKPWEPLKSRQGKPLLLTGRMRASVAAVGLDNGFRIDATASYAAHHQYGTKRRAQRKARTQPVNRRGRFISRVKAARAKGRSVGVRFLPAGEGGLIPQRQMIPMAETGGIPPKWVEVFNRDTSALITRTIRSTT